MSILTSQVQIRQNNRNEQKRCWCLELHSVTRQGDTTPETQQSASRIILDAEWTTTVLIYRCYAVHTVLSLVGITSSVDLQGQRTLFGFGLASEFFLDLSAHSGGWSETIICFNLCIGLTDHGDISLLKHMTKNKQLLAKSVQKWQRKQGQKLLLTGQNNLRLWNSMTVMMLYFLLYLCDPLKPYL